MTKQIEGSSKIFYPIHDDLFLMTFKDAIHGAQREGSILGTGDYRKEFTYYLYRLLESNGIRTHLSPDENALKEDGIEVQKCEPVKIEVLVRNVARGHWVDSHKIPLFEGGQPFDFPIVEFCLKMKKEFEDGRIIDDPRINSDVAIALHKYAKDEEIRGHMIIDQDEANTIRQMALEINSVYREFLNANGWILEDFKFEIGVVGENRSFVLIDEISPDSSRIRDAKGNSLTKDLFRQRRSEEEILQGYATLTHAVKEQVIHVSSV